MKFLRERRFIPLERPIERTASDYSDVEKAQFKEQFALLAKRYRQGETAFAVLVLAGFILFVIGGYMHLPLPMRWVIIVFLLLWVGLSGSALVFGNPVCPACHRGVDCSPRSFCPECGGELVAAMRTHCSLCNKRFDRVGKSRGFKIRYCTHCGILLDERGI